MKKSGGAKPPPQFYFQSKRIRDILKDKMNLEEILKKLISFKTLTHNREDNLACLLWIERFIKKRNINVNIERFSINKSPSLIITTKKTKTPHIWLAGHIDVVYGTEKIFTPIKKDDRLYGRGAFDMKFAIACYLKLLEDVNENIEKYDFGLMLTSDEEIGGENGTEHFVNNGFLSEFVILPDGGENWFLQAEAKAVLHLSVESDGVSADGCRPWLGENAIDKLYTFLSELKNEFAAEPCGDENHWHQTLNIGNLRGGASVNQVAGFASSSLDIRFIKTVDGKRIKKKIKELEDKYNGISTSLIKECNYCSVDKDHGYIKLFSELAKDHFNIKTDFLTSHGNSDARFFLKKGIQTLVVRPKGGGPHTENEWIDLKDLDRFYTVLKTFVKEISLKK